MGVNCQIQVLKGNHNENDDNNLNINNNNSNDNDNELYEHNGNYTIKQNLQFHDTYYKLITVTFFLFLFVTRINT